MRVEYIDIRVFKNVVLITEKIEKNTKMQTHFPPDLGEFLKSRGIIWNSFSPRSGGICNFNFRYWFRENPCKLSVTWMLQTFNMCPISMCKLGELSKFLDYSSNVLEISSQLIWNIPVTYWKFPVGSNMNFFLTC